MIEMKDSGIEWIGEIPAHWDVKRIKDIAYLGSGTTPKSSNEKYYDGTHPWLITGDVQNRLIERNENFITDLALADIPNLKLYPAKTVLLAMYGGGTIGNVGLMTYPAYINQACCAMIPKSGIYEKYLFYYLQTKYSRIISTGVGGTQINLSQNKIAAYPIAVPPFKEQQAIADYLDKKTAEIDEQITALEKKSDAYQRLKRSLISEVVTRGLNPTAELKDPGIEWIGEIPEHWEIDRVKSFAKTIKGKSCDYLSDPTTDCYQVLSVESLRQDECQFYDYVKVDDDSQICSPDDIVVIWDGAGVGEFLRAKNGALSSTIAKVKFTSKKVLPKYFWYWRYKIEYRLKSIPTGMGIPHLNPNLLNNYKIAIPPLVEQQAIADYLDKKTAEIDSNISAISSKIDAYKRLKQSLIDEVVTGKRRIEKA